MKWETTVASSVTEALVKAAGSNARPKLQSDPKAIFCTLHFVNY